MFDRPTVIVLGAGASSDFGFPLGEKLRDKLITEIDAEKRRVEQDDFYRLGPTSAQNVSLFGKDRIRALASYLSSPLAEPYLPKNLLRDQMLKRLFDFSSELKNQTQDTVDQFILENPDHSFIGKVLLSQEIMLNMYHGENYYQLKLRSFANREYGKRRNWYQMLINQIRDGIQDSGSLANNMLSVVTFNYDQSLERALETSLGNTQLHQGANYRDAVDIFHVNGTLAKLPIEVSDVGNFILECAKHSHLVDEAVSPEVRDVRAKASDSIANAERVFVMGFDCAASNVKAIGLQNARDMERVFCLNFDGNLSLERKFYELGIQERQINKGTTNAPLYIDRALRDGFLHQ